MAADTLLLEIVTPQRAVFSESVREVALPGDLGEMDVLPGHLPLMTLIAGGEVTAVTANGTRRFAIDGGFAEILSDRVTILVRSCEGAEDVDLDKARTLLTELEGRDISEGTATEQVLREHREALAKTRARMRIVEHATKR
jgi:F-type H+-transporting ATPase subunit epsilon